MSEEKNLPAKRGRRSVAQRKKDSIDTKEKREQVQTSLGELMVEVNQPKVMSDNQLRERLNGYLNRCYQNRQYPTVEEGFLSTGYTRSYLMDIAQGKSRGKYFSPDAAEIIQKFLDICAAFDAKMVMQGQAPMIGYIYRSKQHYGYSDKTEVQLTSDIHSEKEMSLNELAKRYGIETTFAEDEKTSSEVEVSSEGN